MTLRRSATVALSTLSLALAGCAAGNFTANSDALASSAAVTGRVHGGQQPISGALVQLMEPGTTGYGSAPSLIVAAIAVTDANGAFTFPRPYTCPANSGLVYVLATGGNAGAGTNSAIAEAAILGNCNSLTASTFVNISEVTTVAAAYALAPFATITPAVVSPVTSQSTSIGTSSTNLQGLYNAAGPAANLANNITGFAHARGDIPGVVPPTAELNTLADILASCINQGTANNASGSCATLFSAAQPSGGLTPTDTFQAAVDIAQHPGRNISALFNLVPANAPFQPTLASAPNDFSIALGYNGGALTLGNGNVGIAIDATGNAWIATGTFNANVHELTEITPTGTYPGGSAVAASSGFANAILTAPLGLAIDPSGYIWVCDNGATNVKKLNPNATLNSTITASSFYGVQAVAFDPSGNSWYANFGGANVTEINTSGVEAANSPVVAGSGGVDVAVSTRAVWQTNYQSSSRSLYRIDLTSRAVTSTQIGGSIGDVAIDHSNNAWIAVTGNGSIFEISDGGGYVNTPNGGYIVQGVSAENIGVDGLGNVFAGAANNASDVAGTLLEYSNSGTLLSPGSGFIGSGFIPDVPQVAGGLAIDGSGNVWIAGNSNGTALPLYISEIIGIGAPVVTPKAVATANNTIGTRP